MLQACLFCVYHGVGHVVCPPLSHLNFPLSHLERQLFTSLQYLDAIAAAVAAASQGLHLAAAVSAEHAALTRVVVAVGNTSAVR